MMGRLQTCPPSAESTIYWKIYLKKHTKTLAFAQFILYLCIVKSSISNLGTDIPSLGTDVLNHETDVPKLEIELLSRINNSSFAFGEVIEVKGSYHSFQSLGKLRDNGF